VTATVFVGLGVMGYPMAGHLQAKGHPCTVFNRTASKAEAWVREHGGTSAPSPKAAAEAAEIAFVCVGNDDDVRAVVLGDDGVLAGLAPGSLLVDHTTASATLARELGNAAAERGVGFVDAPVSGGQAGAVNAQLTVMCGGTQEHFDVAAPVMGAYARSCTLVGPQGSGQLAKMVNQICIAGVVQGLSEGLSFAQRSGLDVARVIAAVSQGAAGSWQMSNRWETMAEDRFDFGFAVDWMRKDLAMCLDEARRNGAPLPVAALVDQFYARLQDQGHGRWDTSSLVHLLR
jgi:2-hydroxy-3-oxopropionate reductase